MAQTGERRRIRTLVYSRVVGYYAQVTSFNKGKVQEFADRKVYEPFGKEQLDEASLQALGHD